MLQDLVEPLAMWRQGINVGVPRLSGVTFWSSIAGELHLLGAATAAPTFTEQLVETGAGRTLLLGPIPERPLGG